MTHREQGSSAHSSNNSDSNTSGEHHNKGFTGYNSIVIACLIIVSIAMLLASINPLSWNDYLLHQLGTVVFMAMVWACYRYLASTTTSFVLASLFIVIHIIGARYLYSYVPYNEWTQNLFGINLNEVFGWQRNMYDRLVHFCYGLLLLPLMKDVFHYLMPSLSLKTILLLVLQFNLATSALYELFEWILGITLSPESAEAYNGQQGDIWDAQKDILLAFIGALIGSGLIYLKQIGLNNKKAVYSNGPKL